MTTNGTIQANGQELYYEVRGEGDPVVLLMGIGYDSSLWKLHQVPALSQHFEVLTLDNRDVGRSGRAQAAYTISDMADDVAALLDGLGIACAHVLGLSMGALIGQELTLRHPARVKRLVLCGPDRVPAAGDFHPIAVWRWVKERDETGAIFAAQQFTWLFSSSFRRNPAAVRQTIEFLSSNPHPVEADAYARQAEAYLRYEPSKSPGAMDTPTLVIVGEQDLLTPPWVAREVAAAIPGARLEILRGEGASHVVPLERPEEFNRLVIEFLSEATVR